MPPFQRTMIASNDRAGALSAAADYEVMLVAVLRALLDRFERRGDYPFVDTKLSMLTGADFPPAAEESRDFKGPSAIFGWFQGRGLESLAGHARWLAGCTVLSAAGKEELAARIRRMTAAVLGRLRQIRARNDGHLSFMQTPEGQPFTMGSDGRRQDLSLKDGPWTTTDMFCAKGFLAAAAYLGQADAIDEATAYFRAVLSAADRDDLVSDAVSFDPKNRPTRLPGKYYHGSRMLAMGGLALAMQAAPSRDWLDLGHRFLRNILERHVNRGQQEHEGLALWDLCEAVDAKGRPWDDGGKVICDPGHSCEVVGLAGKFLLLLDAMSDKTPAQDRLLRDCRSILPRVLLRAVQNGYNPQVGGICKTFDLRTRRPINADMPWWNLPETLRAAAEMALLCPEFDPAELWEIVANCSNGFFRSFVNPGNHLMAFQTVGPDGRPVDVIPATPDADPGYHTGLSIIDFLACVRRER